MKNKFLLSFVFMVLGVLWTNAQRQEVQPKTIFDAENAKKMMAFGKSTINGTAVARDYNAPNGLNNMLGVRVVGKKRIAPAGTVVVLFPVTRYFEEYYQLKNRYKKSKKYVAVLGKEAFSYRLETKTDKNGRFSFTKMKPGKYYIETVFGYTGRTGTDVEVGRTDYYNGYGNYTGSDPIYQTYYYNYTEEAIESKFVEVKKDGEILDIKL